jgi:hypothetical protein
MLVNGNNNIPDPSNAPSDTQTVLKPSPNPFANPGTPAGFLNQDPNSLSFILNQDTGNLEIGPKPVVQQQQVQTPAQTQESSKTPDPNEERFLRLEQGIATIASFLEGQKTANLNNLNGQQNQQPQQTQQPEEYDYTGVDVSDPNNIRDIIRNEFKALFSTEIKPLIGKQAELGVRASFNDAATRFGKDFLEGTLPTIDNLIKSGVLKSDPNMDFVNIHLQLKQARLTKPVTATDSTIQPSNGSTPSGQPQTAQELVQRANALSTETPGAQRTIMTNVNPKKGTKQYTVTDAVDDAFNQLFGGN